MASKREAEGSIEDLDPTVAASSGARKVARTAAGTTARAIAEQNASTSSASSPLASASNAVVPSAGAQAGAPLPSELDKMLPAFLAKLYSYSLLLWFERKCLLLTFLFFRVQDLANVALSKPDLVGRRGFVHWYGAVVLLKVSSLTVLFSSLET